MQLLEQQLSTNLDSEINRKKYRYLLIDNLAPVSDLDFIYLDNLSQLLGSNAITTLMRPDLSHSPELCPKLITIAKPHRAIDEDLIHFSLVQAIDELIRTKRYICGWIVSEHPAELVADYLIKIAITIASRCQLSFLPIHEPFNFQLLHESNQISPFWLPSILSICDEYTYLNLSQQLITINGVKSVPSGIDVFLTDNAIFYQKNRQHIFQLFLSWQRYCNEVDKELTPDTLMRVARAYLQAHEAGLTDAADQSIFTLMTLRYGDLLQEPVFQTAVNKAISEPGSLVSEFKLIDKRYFSELSQK